MCIDDSEFKKNGGRNCPTVGEECTVVEAWIDAFDNDDPVFEFAEYEGCIFSQRYFAVLPDTTADEMADAEREAIVNLETVLV